MNPELLLPAGDLTALKTAVDNGADAVYVGALAFSARAGAVNFTESELPQAVAYAHERSANVYLALNTLIADEELDDALTLALSAAACGVDAIILQDVGLAGLIHEVLPDLPLHASTQMTIYDESAFTALKAMGVHRVILPREASLTQVARMTHAAHEQGLETEIFIHGALCVCYSGQCLFSSLTTGRSGNRGACAQPCRLDYRIVEDGRPLAAAACLSPKDQAALRHFNAVLGTGVDALKIEGRMRQTAYVGQTAAVYRSLLDGPPPDQARLDAMEKRLLLAFNRGGAFTDRAFSGKKDASFLSGPYVGSHGVLVGSVSAVKPGDGSLHIRLTDPSAPPGKKDYLSIRRPADPGTSDPAGRLVEVASAPVGTIREQGPEVEVRGFHPEVLTRIRPGDAVFRMNDARTDQAVLAAKSRKTGIGLDMSRSEKTGARAYLLRAQVLEGPFAGVSVEMEAPVSDEVHTPLLKARAAEQLAKTGATPYRVIQADLPESVDLSIAHLNQLRRDTLERLSEMLAARSRREASATVVVKAHERLRQERTDAPDSHKPVEIAAYSYQWPAKGDPIACGADAYLLPAEGLEQPGHLELLADLRRVEPNARQVLVLPPAATGLLSDRLKTWQADGTFSRFDRIAGGHPGLPAMTGHLGIGFEMDSSANIYNHLSLEHYARLGAAVTTVSPELGKDQRLAIARKASMMGEDGPLLEWFVHGRHRLMTSAFCPVGHNVPGCNRCAGKRYQLSDRKGRLHPLILQPPYCTSVILHAESIQPPDELAELIRLAPSRLRLMFFEEDQTRRRQEIRRIRNLVRQYQDDEMDT